MIYYHGGGWIFGTPEQFLQNALLFTRKGYTVYMPSYRRLPFYGFKSIEYDLLTAVKKIGENCNHAVNKLVLSGMSAGAHLTGWLAFHPGVAWTSIFQCNGVNAYIGVGAPLDLSNMWQSPVIKRLAGKKGTDQFNNCNPIYHLDKKSSPKILSISGGKDGIVPYPAQQSFELKAQELNLDISIAHQEGSTHMDISRWSIPSNNNHRVVQDFLSELEE